MARRGNFESNVEQPPWSKREILVTLLILPGLFIGFIIYEMKKDEWLNKTHLVEVGMTLQEAVVILGEPEKQAERGVREELLRDDERRRWADLGKENPLTKYTWEGTGNVFRAFVVQGEIIGTRTSNKTRM